MKLKKNILYKGFGKPHGKQFRFIITEITNKVCKLNYKYDDQKEWTLGWISSYDNVMEWNPRLLSKLERALT